MAESNSTKASRHPIFTGKIGHDLAYLLLVAVVISGVIGLEHKYHATLAFSALTVATLHLIVVIAVKVKAKRASKHR